MLSRNPETVRSARSSNRVTGFSQGKKMAPQLKDKTAFVLEGGGGLSGVIARTLARITRP
jgi:hypothetical protein